MTLFCLVARFFGGVFFSHRGCARERLHFPAVERECFRLQRDPFHASGTRLGAARPVERRTVLIVGLAGLCCRGVANRCVVVKVYALLLLYTIQNHDTEACPRRADLLQSDNLLHVSLSPSYCSIRIIPNTKTLSQFPEKHLNEDYVPDTSMNRAAKARAGILDSMLA